MYGCFEYTDISGTDIKTVSNVASVDVCKSTCASTSGCEVGVYRAAAKQCVLRSKALVSAKNGKNGYDASVQKSCLTVSANPNTAVSSTCLLIKPAGASDSAANSYGFTTSALPASSPGAVLWTQPPSNLYIFMDPDSGSGSGSSGRRLGALENPEAAAGAVVEYVELSLEQEAALVGARAAKYECGLLVWRLCLGVLAARRVAAAL
eukprot:XP_001699347.1 predicted protein [Chlamydomonas reinhardtii]